MMTLFYKARNITLHNQLSGVLEISALRCLSTLAAGEVVRINKNLSFRPAHDSKLGSDQKPIAVVYGWLVAKSQHIHKYGDFYLGRGYDVLHIKIEPLQLLWPRRAQAVVSQIIDFLTEESRSSQPIVVHGFSVGGYLYGETLVKIVSDPTLLESMKKRVRGQIFDSPVDLEGIPRGVGMALSGVPFIQKSIKFILDSYLKLFYKPVTQHYKLASETFYSNALRCPSFFFHSRSDKVGIPGPIESVIKRWRENGVQVQSICWEDSPHVGHFKRHPVQYINALNEFLASVGLQHENKSNMYQLSGESFSDNSPAEQEKQERKKVSAASSQK